MSTGLVVCLHPTVADPAHPSCLPPTSPSSCSCIQDTGELSCSLFVIPDPIPGQLLATQTGSLLPAEFSKGLGCNPWLLFLPEEILHQLELLAVMAAAVTLAPSLFLFPWISLMVARCTRCSSG